MSIENVAREFGLTEQETYRTILWFSNRNAIRLLETEDSLFIGAEIEIFKTKDRMFSTEFIWKDAFESKGDTVCIAEGEYLYFLYDIDCLVYIGQTTNLGRRLADHRKTKQFNNVAYLPVREKDIDIKELLNIAYYRPHLNIAGNSDAKLLEITLSYCEFEGAIT